MNTKKIFRIDSICRLELQRISDKIGCELKDLHCSVSIKGRRRKLKKIKVTGVYNRITCDCCGPLIEVYVRVGGEEIKVY